jgi:hypothetical protein
MPRFDLNDYETVEERIKRFYETYEDGRIITDCVIGGQDGTWLFRAFVYLSASDQANDLPKASGYASEKEGGPNSEWKAELGETSSIGRALANMGLSGNRRATREEMQKVVRAENKDWLSQADRIADVAGLRWLYAQAKASGASSEELERIEARAKALGSSSESDGAGGSLPTGKAEGADK